MQLLKFPMTSILPICTFPINRTANRETTDCWRGRRQGRSLRIRPHPAGCEGRANSTDAVPQFLRFLRLRGSPPLPPAPPIFTSKFDQKSNQKKVQNFDPKWPPKETLKISKISPNLQNGTLKHLSRALLAASISERVSKPSPRTSITSKIIVLL